MKLIGDCQDIEKQKIFNDYIGSNKCNTVEDICTHFNISNIKDINLVKKLCKFRNDIPLPKDTNDQKESIIHQVNRIGNKNIDIIPPAKYHRSPRQVINVVKNKK